MGFALGFAIKALVLLYLGTIVISFLYGLLGGKRGRRNGQPASDARPPGSRETHRK